MYRYGGSDVSQGPAGDNLSTQASNSYKQWMGSIHQVDQYPFTQSYSASKDGNISFNSIHEFNKNLKGSAAGSTLINQVLPEGCRPRRIFSVYEGSPKLVEIESSGQRQVKSTYDYTSHLISGLYGSSFCAGGYNEKTKTLVIISSPTTSSTTHYGTIFKSSKDLNSVKNIKEYFDNLTSTESFNHSLSIAQQHDIVTVVGNNGFVGVSWNNQSQNTLMYEVYDCNVKGVATGQSARQHGTTHTYTGSVTTSYGIAQGQSYYTKFNTTWDGTWGAIYCSYYYHGCGINSYIVNLENPKKFICMNSSRTGSGSLFMPMGRTGFGMFAAGNTDSSPVEFGCRNFDPTDSDETTTTWSVAHLNSGVQLTTATSNGAALPLSNSYSLLHGGYYSTCYPLITTINWWGSYGSDSSSYCG
jgi:hypothetical protein